MDKVCNPTLERLLVKVPCHEPGDCFAAPRFGHSRDKADHNDGQSQLSKEHE